MSMTSQWTIDGRRSRVYCAPFICTESEAIVRHSFHSFVHAVCHNDSYNFGSCDNNPAKGFASVQIKSLYKMILNEKFVLPDICIGVYNEQVFCVCTCTRFQEDVLVFSKSKKVFCSKLDNNYYTIRSFFENFPSLLNYKKTKN